MPMSNAKIHRIDNSCRTFLKGCFYSYPLISHLHVYDFYFSATKKLSLSAIGAVQMKGVLLAEKYQSMTKQLVTNLTETEGASLCCSFCVF